LLDAAAEHEREHPGLGKLRIELDRAVRVTGSGGANARDRRRIERAAVGLEEDRKRREVVRVAHDRFVVRLGGDAHQPPADQVDPLDVVADDHVLEHLAGERQVVGVKREGEEEKKKDSHAANVRRGLGACPEGTLSVC